MEHEEAEAMDGRVIRARLLRERRRTDILLAARRIFAEKGYHAASITDIIDAAGVARGTFYLYFESKRAIFEEIVDTLLTNLRSMIHPVEVESEESPASQLFGSVRRVLQHFYDNPDLTRILLQQAAGLDREFDQKLEDFYGRLLQMLRSSLTIGMSLGLVRQVDPHITVHFILGSLKQAMVAALLQPVEPPVDLDRLAWDIVHYNLQGLRGV
jgi:AcrR family transcriptional regulator